MKSIVVKNLSKRYFVPSVQNKAMSFREMLFSQFWSLFKKEKVRKTFYALDNVSFEVEQGEVLGIIGKNGSGKSTLLKILSKITAPTDGTAYIYGRVASLLEVGTGFHAELTGRENIFMSGIILGMKRWEINNYFDEIVSFAGVQKFLDVPVKKYSSGMTLRLAFSVAAYLSAEVLIIDEVLAVGDAEFQKKCLTLMSSLQKAGKTILFVSHNLPVVKKLCNKVLFLNDGKVEGYGPTKQMINYYLMGSQEFKTSVEWVKNEAPQDEVIAIHQFSIQGTANKTIFDVSEALYIKINYSIKEKVSELSLFVELINDDGDLVFASIDTSNASIFNTSREKGKYLSTCIIPSHTLTEGIFYLSLHATTPQKKTHVLVESALSFKVTDDHQGLGARGNWIGEWPAVAVRPLLKWSIKSL